MSCIFAINCSHDKLSVAVLHNKEIICKEKEARRENNRIVLGLIEELLSECGISLGQLDCIAYGRGPGSFTGLRIAAGVAQGLAYGSDTPVVSVSCMAAIALAQPHQKNLIAIQASRNQFYWSCYRKINKYTVQLEGAECLTAASDIQVEGNGWRGAAFNCVDVQEELDRLVGSTITDWTSVSGPHAREILVIGREKFQRDEYESAFTALPDYLNEYQPKISSKSSRIN